MTLARIGTVAAITTGGILLVMVAVMGALIEAAIRCDRDLEGYDWADDDETSAERPIIAFTMPNPVVTVGPNKQIFTVIPQATW